MHVHQAILTHWATGRFALDLHPDDVFWCTADPGWVTGTDYGIIAPLLHGVTSIVDAAEIVARLAEDCLYDLDAPPVRVCSAGEPMPYAHHMEGAAQPQPDKIIAAVKELLHA